MTDAALQPEMEIALFMLATLALERKARHYRARTRALRVRGLSLFRLGRGDGLQVCQHA